MIQRQDKLMSLIWAWYVLRTCVKNFKHWALTALFYWILSWKHVESVAVKLCSETIEQLLETCTLNVCWTCLDSWPEDSLNSHIMWGRCYGPFFEADKISLLSTRINMFWPLPLRVCCLDLRRWWREFLSSYEFCRSTCAIYIVYFLVLQDFVDVTSWESKRGASPPNATPSQGNKAWIKVLWWQCHTPSQAK